MSGCLYAGQHPRQIWILFAPKMRSGNSEHEQLRPLLTGLSASLRRSISFQHCSDSYFSLLRLAGHLCRQ